FFQAEDGIRDYKVTGVQTCALPILGMRAPDDVSEAARLLDAGAFGAEHVVAVLGKTEGNGGVNDFTRALATLSFRMLIAERSGQIGRASCRERVERWGVAEA